MSPVPAPENERYREPLPSRSTVKAHAMRLMHESGASLAHCLNVVCQEAGLTGYLHFLTAEKNGIQYVDELPLHPAPADGTLQQEQSVA